MKASFKKNLICTAVLVAAFGPLVACGTDDHSVITPTHHGGMSAACGVTGTVTDENNMQVGSSMSVSGDTKTNMASCAEKKSTTDSAADAAADSATGDSATDSPADSPTDSPKDTTTGTTTTAKTDGAAATTPATTAATDAAKKAASGTTTPVATTTDTKTDTAAAAPVATTTTTTPATATAPKAYAETIASCKAVDLSIPEGYKAIDSTAVIGQKRAGQYMLDKVVFLGKESTTNNQESGLISSMASGYIQSTTSTTVLPSKPTDDSCGAWPAGHGALNAQSLLPNVIDASTMVVVSHRVDRLSAKDGNIQHAYKIMISGLKINSKQEIQLMQKQGGSNLGAKMYQDDKGNLLMIMNQTGKSGVYQSASTTLGFYTLKVR